MIRVLIVVSLLSVMNVTHAENVAGTVKTASGKAQLIRGGRTIPIAVGTTVLPGDIVKTEGGAVGVLMKDDSRVTLGPNSQVGVDRFAFNADTHEGGMLVRVVRGTAAFVSGLLVKANPQSVEIRTPTTTIGIRGTEFVVEVP